MLLLNDSVMPETKTVTFGTKPKHLVYFCCCAYKKKSPSSHVIICAKIDKMK